MNWAAIFWCVLLILFVAMEAATVSVVSLWFAGGALAAIGVSMLGGPVWLQILVFSVLSVVLLLCLRPITKKYFNSRLTPTNVDAVIGTQGIVIEEIDNIKACGRVKLGAMEWAARSACGQTIRAGTLVKVEKIEGVKVFVTAVPVTTQEVTL